ncbi:MAG: GIY-YIG nuclease family protein [Candidatus Nanoarchaeia archaeon]|nr:GIY-YIG nuclease family protein [Candidatus Nanoarchaeia archaeon]
MFNYFYKITNLVNGHFYYGVHKTNNLEDGYMGSGKRCNYAQKKYGKKNFKKEIIAFFDTYEQALEMESQIVNEELINDPNCYNLSLQGKGNLRQGPPLVNKITREIIKPNNIEEFNKLFKTGNYEGISRGKMVFKDNNGNKYMLDKNDIKIKDLNLEPLNKERVCYKDKNEKLYFAERDDERFIRGEFILSGTTLGKKQSEETKRKIGLKNLIKQKNYLNSQYGTHWITNEKENKKIHRGDLIPDGWKLGRKIK